MLRSLVNTVMAAVAFVQFISKGKHAVSVKEIKSGFVVSQDHKQLML